MRLICGTILLAEELHNKIEINHFYCKYISNLLLLLTKKSLFNSLLVSNPALAAGLAIHTTVKHAV